MSNPQCPKCKKEMELEEISSYYSDPDWEWTCNNPKCRREEE